MAACDLDFSALPILSLCPGPNELFLVSNAVGGLDQNGNYTTGYGRRYYSDIKACILQGMSYTFTQFTVGQPGALIAQGSSAIVINAPNYVNDSLTIFIGGVQLPRNDNSQLSYVYGYVAGQLAITFNQPAQNGQQYIIFYANS